MSQTLKLNLKLYDEVDEDKVLEETRNPIYGILGLFFFIIVFFGLCVRSPR